MVYLSEIRVRNASDYNCKLGLCAVITVEAHTCTQVLLSKVH